MLTPTMSSQDFCCRPTPSVCALQKESTRSFRGVVGSRLRGQCTCPARQQTLPPRSRPACARHPRTSALAAAELLTRSLPQSTASQCLSPVRRRQMVTALTPAMSRHPQTHICHVLACAGHPLRVGQQGLPASYTSRHLRPRCNCQLN